jgi:hypothetical protein
MMAQGKEITDSLIDDSLQGRLDAIGESPQHGSPQADDLGSE